jgi:serine/threonine-protein kinase RsbW
MKEGFTIIKSLKLPSNNDAIGLVENLIDEICVELAVNEDAYGNVLIAVTEGINNAIQHGNKYSKDLFIALAVANNSAEFCFSITDQGDGFDYDALPDPTAPENIMKENGRGVYLMRNLADEVIFEELGKTVCIYFKR